MGRGAPMAACRRVRRTAPPRPPCRTHGRAPCRDGAVRRRVVGCGRPAAPPFEREGRHAGTARERHRTRRRVSEWFICAAAGAVLECSVGARPPGGGRPCPDRDLATGGIGDGGRLAGRGSAAAPHRAPGRAKENAGAPMTGTASTTATDFYAK